MTPAELERAVAKVICKGAWENDSEWEVWLPEARAALAVVRDALRKPTLAALVNALHSTERVGMSPGELQLAAEKLAEQWGYVLAASPIGEKGDG